MDRNLGPAQPLVGEPWWGSPGEFCGPSPRGLFCEQIALPAWVLVAVRGSRDPKDRWVALSLAEPQQADSNTTVCPPCGVRVHSRPLVGRALRSADGTWCQWRRSHLGVPVTPPYTGCRGWKHLFQPLVRRKPSWPLGPAGVWCACVCAREWRPGGGPCLGQQETQSEQGVWQAGAGPLGPPEWLP